MSASSSVEGHTRDYPLTVCFSRVSEPCDGCCTPRVVVPLKEVLYPQVRGSQCLEKVLYLLRKQDAGYALSSGLLPAAWRNMASTVRDCVTR